MNGADVYIECFRTVYTSVSELYIQVFPNCIYKCFRTVYTSVYEPYIQVGDREEEIDIQNMALVTHFMYIVIITLASIHSIGKCCIFVRIYIIYEKKVQTVMANNSPRSTQRTITFNLDWFVR